MAKSSKSKSGRAGNLGAWLHPKGAKAPKGAADISKPVTKPVGKPLRAVTRGR